MTATTTNFHRARLVSALLVGTMLGGLAQPALAQQAAAAPATPAPVPAASEPAALAPARELGVIKSVNVAGSERLEPDTVRSYVKLAPGETYTREALDQALKDLYETELFADVQVRDDGSGNITLQVRENPVVNRIVLEGNKRLKSDKINPEIKLAPRQIFTRSKVRADVNRIIELYRRQGRFAATVEPKMVQLDQNRVDIIFEIHEGDKSKVRKINIIGNEKFSDGRLRGEMATKQTGITKIFSSGTSYDPDRMSYDQQKLRQYYLTQGYADFRVVSAVAELTPDKKDFIITYVVEEGQRYKFGDVDLESDIRDIKASTFKYLLPMHKGDWYNAKLVEDTVDSITEATGVFGFTPDVRPDFNRDKDELTMGVVFKINQSPRVYVERIDINGNTHTKDKVVRREFRLSEGDAFNSFKVKRSRDRIQSLGFFQDKFEVEQKPGSAPDRVVLEANVEEKSTGELQVSAGYSSLERFIVDLSIRERNFMGKGQELRAGVSYSTYSKSIELGFTEPYVFDKNIAVGVDLFRRDYNSFSFSGNDRNTTYEQTTTGFQIRAGVPLTEFITLATRYGLSYDKVALNKFTYYTDTDNDGVRDSCDPIIAGRYLCDAIGNRLTSSVGYSLVFDNLNNRIRPSRGQRAVFSQDFAGLGGKVRYIKSSVQATKYWGLGGGFIFSAGAEGGYIKGLGQDIRLVDRFYLGEPDMRGFGIRGVGPRVIRRFIDPQTGQFAETSNNNLTTDDALGGNTYYKGRLELEIPLGNGARELGLRPSIFMDVGAVFGVKKPALTAPENAGYPFLKDENGNYIPVIRNQLDSQGRQIYIVAAGQDNAGFTTLCAVGYSDSAKKPCVGGVPGVTNDKATNSISPFREDFVGDSAKPRLSVGFGVNWNSPFGPFRIDVAKALLKERGDNTKLFTFNVGTQF
ncbi:MULTISPECIES: outer membrane protein assembly factor BamA [unclassified Sphingomonas]|uniref:outer membrane protein assembly factor BamA n=1 Tax=unclassified Sphingomonas TaxID=196159 RepID=UPI0006FC43C7|nr:MULTISPECIES: outer membrane protein assembly factor BamA [unclassified Sphingomonas]KQX19975.1 outer membrane protein assembly factor BamA [Sphingomonas sp. Root1294]KQY67222.1 outer membrane protein assembly factor BamA [Sphingomonas sp. Root50]KRB90596.1 outer membrane protein assembly factor BamA [Sphingomonas sp. Root720]